MARPTGSIVECPRCRGTGKGSSDWLCPTCVVSDDVGELIDSQGAIGTIALPLHPAMADDEWLDEYFAEPIEGEYDDV